jgi:PadR family transcriptional regulator, regulatory protein PadR
MAGDNWLGMIRRITIARGLALGKFSRSMGGGVLACFFFLSEETFFTPKRLMGKGEDPSMADKKERPAELLQGTLDLLILKSLERGGMHGYGVAEWIHESSQDVLRVEEGALYPALHRLELRGWLSAQWGISENNRRAKYYALTAAGKKQLAQETEYWRRMSGAMARVLQTA